MAKEIRRLGRERIESALECLKDCGHAQAIHCARKDIKKARAVLRVARTNIAEKEFRWFSNVLRKAARHLAAPRDAYVKAKTLENLVGHFKGRLPPKTFGLIYSHSQLVSNEEMQRFVKEEKAKTVDRILHRVAKRFERLEISGRGWKVIGAGVKSAYSKGRRAQERASKDPSPENFHDWRKRAKDLWYQASLLQPVWPEQMDAMASELETLGEYLGDDHDLFVLWQSLEERDNHGRNRRKLDLLQGLIKERQCELRAAAFALGRRFYAEKPTIFCDRLAGYWHIWRREKDQRIRPAKTTP